MKNLSVSTHTVRDTYARRNGRTAPPLRLPLYTRALHRTRGYFNRTPGPILLYYFYNIVTVSNEIGATGSAGAPSNSRQRFEKQRYGSHGAGISVSSEQPSASSWALKFVCGLLNASKHIFNG